MSDSSNMHVVVVGIGAMGGGMARALLDSDETAIVVGYDKSTEAVERFYKESKQVQKAPAKIPTSLSDAISKDTQITVISLVNEAQCEQVCFGGGDESNLLNLMPKGSCVVLTSTVTGTQFWLYSQMLSISDSHTHI
jgi:3-hydroxyisobutyrate dehydrogenase-like beta-hydroxyacid dehydrogenase